MEQKMSLKSFSSRDDVLVNNYVFKFNKDLRVQANHIERNTFSKIEKKSCCKQVCSSMPLIFKNFYLKMIDHMLLGGEQAIKVSPGFNSPICRMNSDITSEEKKEIVMASPSFGMFSLFKYHIQRGYQNQELKKENKILLSHIFSLLFALPVLVFMGQWMLFFALIINESNNYGGTLCPNEGDLANKLMICGTALIYFARSFFLWDGLTDSLNLSKMNKVDSYTSILDTFQEFSFSLVVYGANLWIVFFEYDIQNMILNSLAMEFLMVLDNEFEEFYFKYLPGAADDIYDNVFVSYHENKQLLLDRKENDKCFRCFSGIMFIPYKLLVISLFLFPFFCLFGTIAGPVCK